MKTNLFIGRKKELKQLSGLLGHKRSSFVVIKGRRRIGKSRLAQEFADKAKGYRSFYFTALPPAAKLTAQDEREDFAQQLAKAFSMPPPRADDWNTLLWALAERVNKGKYIIVLDEINWMGSKDPTFLGKLKSTWDRDFSKTPQLIVILSGSLTSWIDSNILHSAGFLGRITLDLTLRELPLSDCTAFWGARKDRITPYEKFRLLCITGGIPRYLEEIAPNKSAEENIQQLCYDPSGLLFREFNDLFDDLFKKRNKIYRDIVTAISGGRLDFDALHETLARQKSGVLATYVEDLVKCDFISRDFTWTIKDGKESKLSYLRLSDNYLRFYLKAIAPYKRRIEKGSFRKPANLDGLLGLQFENLVLNNRKSVWAAIGIDMQDIVFENPFFQRKTKRQKGCQIDYMIHTRQKTLYICEIKYRNKPIPASITAEVEEKIQRISMPRHFNYRPVLIHVNGVDDAVSKADYFDEIIDFQALLSCP